MVSMGYYRLIDREGESVWLTDDIQNEMGVENHELADSKPKGFFHSSSPRRTVAHDESDLCMFGEPSENNGTVGSFIKGTIKPLGESMCCQLRSMSSDKRFTRKLPMGQAITLYAGVIFICLLVCFLVTLPSTSSEELVPFGISTNRVLKDPYEKHDLHRTWGAMRTYSSTVASGMPWTPTNLSVIVDFPKIENFKRFPLKKDYKKSPKKLSHTDFKFVNMDESDRTSEHWHADVVDAHMFLYYAFYIDLKIGSNNQTIPVFIDTGSGALIIPSTSCAPELCASFSTPFDEKKSTSYKHIEVGKYKFLSGSVSGRVASDSISIDDMKANQLAFLLVDSTDGIIMKAELGLAHDVTADLCVKHGSFISQALAQGMFESPIFSIYIMPDEINGNEIIFGGVDKELHEGKMHWFSSRPNSYTIELKGIYQTYYTDHDSEHQGKKVETNLTLPKMPRLIIDSGSNRIAFSREILNEILQHVPYMVAPADGTFIMLHKYIHLLPTIRFVVEGTELTIEPEYYIQPLGTIVNLLIAEAPVDAIILGLPFMTKYYTAYNYVEKKVGVARAIHRPKKNYM